MIRLTQAFVSPLLQLQAISKGSSCAITTYSFGASALGRHHNEDEKP
ncbi:hypothetical protein [Tropicibacter sp. Alg240-R139]|nr:hypothetical protein [Tropicibacter sp. Alg240-R139]